MSQATSNPLLDIDPSHNFERGAEKITLRLSPEARETLEWIAAHYGCSLAEAMRRALGTERYLLEQREKGASILIEDRPGARMRELVLR